MVRYERALRLVLEAAGELPVEEVALLEAAGRAAAYRIAACEPLPGFDNSAMDGYAVRSRETAGATGSRPVRLRVLGRIAAGDAEPRAAGGDGAFEIMTGAVVPKGFDAVVPVEHVRVVESSDREGPRAIELTAPAEAGEFVRRAGADLEAGTPVVEAGTRLDERHLLALASLGVTRLKVRRKPRVAVLSTGRELVEPEATPRPGQVRNSTQTYLVAALRSSGCEAAPCGATQDDPEEFKRRVRKAADDGADVVATTGAVSMGRHDFVPQALQELGAELLFHKVATRPGKPVLCARLPKGPWILAMPGNPVSTAVAFRFFLSPALDAMRGLPRETPFLMRLESDVSKADGLRCFFKARASVGSEGSSVRVLPGQASFQVRPLVQADAWAVFPEAGERFRAGHEVEVFPIRAGAADWSKAEHEAAV